MKDAISKEQGEYLSEGDIKKFSPILKDEYLMDFMDISDEIKEKAFQQHFIKSVVEFFLELNSGFALVGKKHHMELSGGDYYEDLLFYNLKLKCYIAVELKIGKFKPEYLGILTFHLSAMDDSVRDEGDNSSIGIVLCKDGEKLIVQYAFKDVDDPKNAEYMLSENIPEQFEGILPTIKEIGRGIKIKLKD
ncbi:PDDEXK nuclease domain-containing protein [Clostridium ljungdahlii]|uniref:PDDEXK nuclease domain-containing protein n=1 Tax=Clostridium ljungdahlii TaxID=1538 RepID=UPI00386C5FBC